MNFSRETPCPVAWSATKKKSWMQKEIETPNTFDNLSKRTNLQTTSSSIEAANERKVRAMIFSIDGVNREKFAPKYTFKIILGKNMHRGNPTAIKTPKRNMFFSYLNNSSVSFRGNKRSIAKNESKVCMLDCAASSRNYF